MKSNGYTNVNISRELPNKVSKQSAIRSLRSIINETKIPLSDYINNQRPSIEKNKNIERVRTKTSYFDKFRGMIGTAIQEEKIQTQKLRTPLKTQEKQRQNIQEQNFNEFNSKTIDHTNNSHILRRKRYNNNETPVMQRSRSKSKTQNDKLTDYQKKLQQRFTYQPLKVKTQHYQNTIIQKDTSLRLPPKPVRTNCFNQRKSQITKKSLNIIQQDVLSGRMSEINPQKAAFSQIKAEHCQREPSSKTEVIENIHSHRRLNFCKQQERRKEVIIYGKKFQEICHNVHCNQIAFIESYPIQISQVLGNGAYSYVRHGILKGMGLHQKFAIKIYEKYKLIEPAQKNRVTKQIQILSSLNHPNIIKLFCAYQNKREIHLLFQQIEESITLQQYFKHNSLKFHDQSQLMLILKEIVKGLAYLHSLGVAHRDVKPDNILISFKQNYPIVKLIDFGFATTSAMSSINCGTPNFMAPELFKKQPYSPIKTDAWAIGIMMYYLMEGKYPYRGYNEKDLIRNICENKLRFDKTYVQMANIISLLLQSSPDSRIQMDELLHLLENL